MILDNGFVINAPIHLLPSFKISPFQTIDIYKNKKLSSVEGLGIEEYLLDRFVKKSIQLTDDGRSALNIALATLKLRKNDIVTIFTTTNKPYISSCVTNEIEKYCLWSRNIQKNTKVILVNHEFGYCSQKMKEYSDLGYPIIEDFAHSFISNSEINDAGNYGDFLVFSFSKYFPIQVGGALLYSKDLNIKPEIKNNVKEYIRNICSSYISLIPKIKEKRLKNYEYYSRLFSTIGLKEYFELKENDCPAVFCVEIPKKINLNKLKIFVNSQGIESSVFYGENAYFLPCHQNLEKCDIEYIFFVVKFFLEANK
ncbi:DegT/DnrJ/EryC1/StrS family aminotransferase [Acinetobacter bereziniae]|uniref:DegT/DnrJ/EryC1/StrS family aminotransferase n=1 Tax=Acinetobacter bereziniae TaxID=106648 RepID=UPI0039C298D4